MAFTPLYPPKFRAFDSNGDPLSGGLLYTYAAGTTTPEPTYTTSEGDVANANPVVLDANGEADVWMTEGVIYKLELRSSAGVVQWTKDDVPAPGSGSGSSGGGSSGLDAVTVDPGGRLTLTSATPLTTADVTAATTVYYVPHRHNKVPLYDGTSWALYTVETELSQTTADNTKSPVAVVNNSCYDLFVWDDDGTLRLSRGPVWASDTSRGTGAGTTELERLNGRYVNKVSISNGPAARTGLYVGTVRSDGSAQINDSLAKRHVWNMYQRTVRSMRVTEATDSWDYQTTTIRQARASTANQLDLVIGISEDEVEAQVDAHAAITVGADPSDFYAGVGLDSTTAFAAGFISHGLNNIAAGFLQPAHVGGLWRGHPGVGRHYLAWLERGNGGGAQTWYGDRGQPTLLQSGIHGRVLG